MWAEPKSLLFLMPGQQWNVRRARGMSYWRVVVCGALLACVIPTDYRTAYAGIALLHILRIRRQQHRSWVMSAVVYVYVYVYVYVSSDRGHCRATF